MDRKWSLIILCVALVFSITGCGKKRGPGNAGGEDPVCPVVPSPSSDPITEERVLFSFEQGTNGFDVPEWFREKPENAAVRIGVSKKYSSEGSQSLEVESNFPGQIWSASMVELEQYLDLTPYRQISVDVLAPRAAPMGLKAKIILTIGDQWKWTEMICSVPLAPGEWATVNASVEPGSMSWKRTEVGESFRSDIRKIVVRVESNKSPIYKGPVYIDNIRVGR